MFLMFVRLLFSGYEIWKFWVLGTLSNLRILSLSEFMFRHIFWWRVFWEKILYTTRCMALINFSCWSRSTSNIFFFIKINSQDSSVLSSICVLLYSRFSRILVGLLLDYRISYPFFFGTNRVIMFDTVNW